MRRLRRITQARVNCPACDGTGRDCGYRAPRPAGVRTRGAADGDRGAMRHTITRRMIRDDEQIPQSDQDQCQSACCAGRPEQQQQDPGAASGTRPLVGEEARSPSSTRSAQSASSTPMTSPRSTPSTSTTTPGGSTSTPSRTRRARVTDCLVIDSLSHAWNRAAARRWSTTRRSARVTTALRSVARRNAQHNALVDAIPTYPGPRRGDDARQDRVRAGDGQEREAGATQGGHGAPSSATAWNTSSMWSETWTSTTTC